MSETKETVAAAAIIDVMMNGDKSWRDRLADSDFLESADWATASAYARAVRHRPHPVPIIPQKESRP